MNNGTAFIASLLYLFATLGFLLAVIRKRPRIAKIATGAMFAALLAQAGAFAIYHLQGISVATFGVREFSLALSLCVCTVFLVFQLCTKTRLLGVFVAPVVLSLSVVTVLAGSTNFPLAASGGYLAFHVAFAVAGEAFFIVATLSGALFLVQETLIRKKKAPAFVRLLPPLGDLDRINHLSIIAGFPVLTVGIIIGAIAASMAGNGSWFYDAKGIWTLAAWFFYTVILTMRTLGGLRGRRVAIVALAALCVLSLMFLLTMGFPSSWHRLI